MVLLLVVYSVSFIPNCKFVIMVIINKYQLSIIKILLYPNNNSLKLSKLL